MKKILLAVLILLIFGAGAWVTFLKYTKSFSPAVEVKAQNSPISVLYSQPSKKGREIFGGLVPFGQVWRTGANEATVINFGKDVEIDGKNLKAGSYSLWTIPNAQTWDIIFNAQTGQWGTQYDESKNVLIAKAQVSLSENVNEKFEIRFEEQQNCNLVLHWDKTLVKLPIKTN